MRVIILMLAGMLFLSGCTQALEKTAGELQMCLEKCQSMCNLIKESNMSLDGYDQVGLTKQSGNVKVSCSCVCS